MCHQNIHFAYLLETVRALRGEDGCPWDRRQTTRSMVKYLHAEVAELVAAIDKDDIPNIQEELGDLFFILIMMTQINQELEQFTIDEVLNAINEKLIRRHPHVFAGVEITDEVELRAQWQRIKAEEKAKKL